MKNSQNTGEKKKITIDGFNEEIHKKGGWIGWKIINK